MRCKEIGIVIFLHCFLRGPRGCGITGGGRGRVGTGRTGAPTGSARAPKGPSTDSKGDEVTRSERTK